MAAQQEWIDDVRRWCFDGDRADPPLRAAALTADAADTRAAPAVLRPESSQAMAALRAVATPEPNLPGA